MSRAAVGVAAAGAFLAAAAAADMVVGGLSGLLYAAGVLMVGLFLAVKLQVLHRPAGSGEGRWQRKSVVIAGLRAELEEREQDIAELRGRLEQKTVDARVLQARLEARIHELESAQRTLQALLEEERTRCGEFLGALTGGIGERGDEIDALERELAALVSG